jgi:aspartate--ammonia ligase
MLDIALELSSMGIRVNKERMEKQLKIANKEERKELTYHQNILNDVLPLTIGGGIGQSRLCMYFLKKAHIGEVQASLWSNETRELCKKHQIHLL